ncbi:hypothetical protein BH24ACT23_BH24ACT23_12130 [soil metagenome]
MSLSRRAFLGRTAAAGAAATLPAGLIAAAPAQAQESDRSDALERLVLLEQAAELAYSLAAEDSDLEEEIASTFAELSSHCGMHATALSEVMDQLNAEPPDSSDDPADYESLKGYDSGDRAGAQLDFLDGLEVGLIEAYGDAVPALEAGDLARTAAQIAAGHAQHLVALRLLADVPADEITDLPAASTSATASTEP